MMNRAVRLLIVLSVTVGAVVSLKPSTAAVAQTGKVVFDNLSRVSPDGQLVAYVTARNLGMAGSVIWVANADGSGARQLVTAGDGFWVTNPVWSPDSSQIAYLKVIETKRTQYEVDSRFELWVISLDGSHHSLLTDTPRLNPSLGYGGEADIVWNANGEIEFDDDSVYPTKRYAIHHLTHIMREVGMAQALAVGSQPSNVPFFPQCGGPWGNHELGTCSGKTVCSHGCYVTSAAMVFKYFGVDTDPGALNAWLTNNEGYANGCELDGGQAVNYHSNIHSFVRVNDEDWNRLNSELEAGYPVIAKVTNAYGDHFVVVTHRSGGTYYLNDPLATGPDARTLASYGSSFSGLRIFHGNIDCCTDNRAPDGDYYDGMPEVGGWYRDSVSLKVWVRDHSDYPSGVDEVLFRAYYGGQWHTVHSDGTDCPEANTCDYEYTWDLDGLPDGEILLGLDIRDGEGNWAYTPGGVILIYKYSNEPPSISFDTANGDSFPSGRIESRDRDWTFEGTASDPEGHLNRVEFRCTGDDCGSYHSQSGLSDWTYERHGMAGQNDVHFVAYDDEHGTDSRHLDLRIDLAPPSTGHNLDGTLGENDWYVSPVEVRLHADDGSTGRARVGVGEIHYRIDGGGWQTHSGDTRTLTVSTDGTHTVEYYAVDDVGNAEGSHSVPFKIDATPPDAPGAASETHGAVSGEWQRDWDDPDFTWGSVSDATSGLWYYRVDWDGTLQVVTDTAYGPPAVRTGSYDLRVRAVDKAGNVGPEGASFTFRYDGTPPHAPDIQNNDGVPSGVWQNEVRTADFFWATPHDEGSGIAGYNVYWGPIITGTSDTLVTGNTFVDPTPICAEDEAATYYLRARSQDNVDWRSEWVGYALAYDGAPPTATLIANYGLTVTHQTNVHLDIVAEDEGSGVTQMRLSNDARTWSEWEEFAEETYWEIPAIGRRFHPIYLQVVDGAENLSEVISDTVYLDVNVPRPQSDNFWLWDDMMTAGGAVVTSTNYHLRSSVGQSLDAPQSASASYLLYSGFQAGALAAPTETPTYTTYFQMGYVVSGGGACTPTLQSAGYRMYGTLGQPAHVRTITSANYVLFSGFWGGAGTDPKPPEPPEPPDPPHPPECEFYSITINDGALFTNQPDVTLGLCGPDPAEMMLSNDGGFGGAAWQPYTRTVPWTLEVYGAHVLPRFVYARYRDGGGEIHGTFFDDIIYDPNAPAGEAAFDLADLLPATYLHGGARPLQTVSQESVELYVSAGDDSSGLAEMQVSMSPDFEGAAWEPYSAIVPVTFDEDGVQTAYVRFRDNAGNVSEPSSDSLIVDTTPPTGTVSVAEGVVGSDAISVTMVLSATDNATGVSEVRISARESFTDTLWRPYASQVAVPISYTGEMEPVLYVQFRDGAGNASEVYTTTYLVDTAPPVLYVGVVPGDTLTRTVTILAYDELTDLGQMWLSNDPLMLDGVVTMPYTHTVTWAFDERRVIWVQLADSVGNVSEPYPPCALPTNTLPDLYGLPDLLFDHSTSPPGTIDLWAYAWDAQTPVDVLTYTVEGPPPTGAGVMLDSNRYVVANPSPNWCGGTDVTVRVTDPGGLWDEDTFRVAVSWSCPGPVEMPGAPVLIAPVDGRAAHGDAPTFAWHPVGGAETYQIQVDDADNGHPADFSSPERDETTSVTEFALPSGLGGGTYTWRVRPMGDGENGDWLEGWAFTVLPQSSAERKIYLPVVVRTHR